MKNCDNIHLIKRDKDYIWVNKNYPKLIVALYKHQKYIAAVLEQNHPKLKKLFTYKSGAEI